MNETTNITQIDLNENIQLTIKLPSEVDIATFEGTYEMVRKISRAVGAIVPMKRTYAVGRRGWSVEKAKQYIEDVKKLGTDEMVKKYDMGISKNKKKYVGQKAWYLKNKFGL